MGQPRVLSFSMHTCFRKYLNYCDPTKKLAKPSILFYASPMPDEQIGNEQG